MAFTLVDGGLPAFVWKKKRIEVPFSEAEKLNLQLQFETGLLTLKQLKQKKKYRLQDNTQANLETYRKLIQKLPKLPGKLVIGLSTDNSFKPLTLLQAEFDLREAFKQPLVLKDGSTIDRFVWLKNLTKGHPNTAVVFFLATESSSTASAA